MATFFQGNPFSSPTGQLIEKATDGTQASENWGLIMEVCDQINENDEGPKDAMRALRKRMMSSIGKNNTSVMYALTVLETAVKNCGTRFHMQVASKEFLQDLIKIIGPKYDPPQIVQEKVLSLIQSWADAFHNQQELKEVEKMYVDLKSKGIEFPMTDLDCLAPIHTPAKTVSVPGSPAEINPCRPSAPSPTVEPSHSHMDLSPKKEHLIKLRQDLDIVQGNIKVFDEMLNELVPGECDPTDMELLHELNRTCHQMQPRIVELIEKVTNEEITNELLKVNDDLNNVFIRYDGLNSYTGTTYPPINHISDMMNPPPPYTPRQEPEEVNNLIDLGDNKQISGDLQLLDLEKSQDEFDMFAQSRQSFDANCKTSASYNEQQQLQYQGSIGSAVMAKSQNYGHNLLTDDEDADEIEAWLNSQPNNNTSEPVTSAEFDDFLAERAGNATGTSSTMEKPDRSATSPNRHLKNDDPTDAMFAL